MLKFQTRKSVSVKFFYPWDTIDTDRMHEEMIELIWNSDNYQENIAAILKQTRFQVKDWDWEDDGDDFIEVFFNEGVSSDALKAIVDSINENFSYLWDSLVRRAKIKVLEYEEDGAYDDYVKPEDTWDADIPEVSGNWEVPKVDKPNMWDTNNPPSPDRYKPLRDSGVRLAQLKPLGTVCLECGRAEDDCICKDEWTTDPKSMLAPGQYQCENCKRAIHENLEARCPYCGTPKRKEEEGWDIWSR